MTLRRKCSICGETKPLEEFSKNRTKTWGRNYYCKACRHVYYESTREHKSEVSKAYYKANRDKVLSGVERYQKARKERKQEIIDKVIGNKKPLED